MDGVDTGVGVVRTGVEAGTEEEEVGFVVSKFTCHAQITAI